MKKEINSPAMRLVFVSLIGVAAGLLLSSIFCIQYQMERYDVLKNTHHIGGQNSISTTDDVVTQEQSSGINDTNTNVPTTAPEFDYQGPTEPDNLPEDDFEPAPTAPIVEPRNQFDPGVAPSENGTAPTSQSGETAVTAQATTETEDPVAIPEPTQQSFTSGTQPFTPGTIDSPFILTSGSAASSNPEYCFGTTLDDLEADIAWVRETDRGLYCMMVFSVEANSGQTVQVVKSYGPGNIRTAERYIEAIFNSNLPEGAVVTISDQNFFSGGDIVVGGELSDSTFTRTTLASTKGNWTNNGANYQNCHIYAAPYSDIGLEFGIYNNYYCETGLGKWSWVGRTVASS